MAPGITTWLALTFMSGLFLAIPDGFFGLLRLLHSQVRSFLLSQRNLRRKRIPKWIIQSRLKKLILYELGRYIKTLRGERSIIYILRTYELSPSSYNCTNLTETQKEEVGILG